MEPPRLRAERIRRHDADREIAPIEDGLARRDPAAIDRALAYLEADPSGFRTGYAKQRLLRRLRSQPLDAAARRRVGALALRGTRQGFRGGGREYARLLRKYATNDLRRALRERMHDPDPRVAWRATWLLLYIRHPALAPGDVAAARELLRAEAARQDRFLYRDTRAFARRLWTTEWEQELRHLARTERDLGARRLLDDARQRARMREWRASKRRESATRSAEAPSEE